MIRLLQDRVLVKPSIRQLSEVLIVKNRESFNMGTVVSVGPGKRDKRGNVKPLDAKVGDEIRYGNGDYLKWPTVKLKGEEYQIIQEADICWIEREQDAA
jgi:chaperonin GroES